MYTLPNITGRNYTAIWVWYFFEPISHFSSEAKQKRQLKKTIDQRRAGIFVDRSFPKQWVASITGLRW
jgi:hypothetical protein